MTLTEILNANPVLPYADAMRATPQPEQWHGEEDVLARTKMVIRELDKNAQCLSR